MSWRMASKQTIHGEEEGIPSSFNVHIVFSKSENS